MCGPSDYESDASPAQVKRKAIANLKRQIAENNKENAALAKQLASFQK